MHAQALSDREWLPPNTQGPNIFRPNLLFTIITAMISQRTFAGLAARPLTSLAAWDLSTP